MLVARSVATSMWSVTMALRFSPSKLCIAPLRTIRLRSLCCSSARLQLNQPTGANDLHRAGGIATMMRLPYQPTAEGLDACFVGIALDSGCSNRSGTRMGPRQIRTESCLMRRYGTTGACPYESLQVADVGDIPVNPYNIKKACDIISAHMSKIIASGCKPITLGGDHTLTYPILQAMKEKYGPVGLVHVDAHDDTQDIMFGEKLAHGTPFLRAVEEGLLDCKRVIQIGLRGSQHTSDGYLGAAQLGFRQVPAEECWHKSLTPLMSEVRKMMKDGPVYISFDIDGLDPAFAPGTGTPEVGGLTVIQGLEIVRGCRGMNVVGADVVEVSPPYDQTGTTALTAANLAFELLCILPGVKYNEPMYKV